MILLPTGLRLLSHLTSHRAGYNRRALRGYDSGGGKDGGGWDGGKVSTTVVGHWPGDSGTAANKNPAGKAVTASPPGLHLDARECPARTWHAQMIGQLITNLLPSIKE